MKGMTRAQTAFSWPVRLIRAARYRVAAAEGEARLRAVRRMIADGGALRGKVAVVTGAGAGIGLATARTFGCAGAHCVLLTLLESEGEAAAASFARQNLSAELIVADVSDEAQVREAAVRIKQHHPTVDILVNNAGIRLDADYHTTVTALSDDVIFKTLAVNLFGAVHVTRALLDAIPRGGRIINMSSVMGRLSHKPDGKSTAYMISKAALNSYTRSLAFDLQPRGIMADCVHPGWVKTPLGGPGAQIEPEEATDMAFFLATRQPSTLTGCFWKDGRVLEW